MEATWKLLEINRDKIKPLKKRERKTKMRKS